MTCKNCNEYGEVDVDERETNTIRWVPCDECRCTNCGSPTIDGKCTDIEFCVKELEFSMFVSNGYTLNDYNKMIRECGE